MGMAGMGAAMGGYANPAQAAAAMAMGAYNPAAMGMGCNPAAMHAMMLQQKQMGISGMMPMPGMPNMSMPVNQKKQRELYVGNLPSGISEAMIKELFAYMLGQCEGYDAALGPSVLNVQLCGGGTYAFVEFRDEQCCETCMQFTGMVVSNKVLKVRRTRSLSHPHATSSRPAL